MGTCNLGDVISRLPVPNMTTGGERNQGSENDLHVCVCDDSQKSGYGANSVRGRMDTSSQKCPNVNSRQADEIRLQSGEKIEGKNSAEKSDHESTNRSLESSAQDSSRRLWPKSTDEPSLE